MTDTITSYCRTEHRRAIMVARRIRTGNTKITPEYRPATIARWLARAATVRRKLTSILRAG